MFLMTQAAPRALPAAALFAVPALVPSLVPSLVSSLALAEPDPVTPLASVIVTDARAAATDVFTPGEGRSAYVGVRYSF